VVLLLVVGGCLLWLGVASYARQLGFADLTRRGSLVIGYLAFQLLTVAVVELASVGDHLHRSVVTLAWLAVDLALVVLCRRPLVDLGRTGRQRLAGLWRRRPAPTPDQLVAGAVLVVFLAALVLMGWLYRPANNDSHAYHLSRVEHWLQAGSVAPFAAHFLAQVELAPLSAYHFAVLKLVTGTDRWDGYVELSAAVVCVLGASELGRRLGLSGRGQMLTAVVAATVPNLLLEATSTTNNLFGASIGVGALVVLTSGLGAGGWLSRAAALGAVAGLAELAKGTLIVMVGPACLVLVVVALAELWREHGPAVVLRRSAGAAVVGAVAAVAVAGPFLHRNIELFGGVAGPVTKTTIVSGHSPGALAGNVIRSVAAQFLVGGDEGALHDVSRAVTGPLHALYDAVGGDDGPDYVFQPDVSPFADREWATTSRFEDVGANPLHTVLIGLALVVLVGACLAGRRSARLPLALALALCVGFLGFAGTATWSIYASRYYLPLFVLWSPLVAVAVQQLGGKAARFAGRATAAVLVVAALPLVFDNYSRSLIHADWRHDTPLEAYFGRSGSSDGAAARSLAADYTAATKAIADSGCHKVGLATHVGAEYAFWVGLEQQGWSGKIYDIDVTNVSKALTPRGFKPCVVVIDSGGIGFSKTPPPIPQRMTSSTYGTLTVYFKGRLGRG